MHEAVGSVKLYGVRHSVVAQKFKKSYKLSDFRTQQKRRPPIGAEKGPESRPQPSKLEP